jgi:hypothetical protein
MEAGECAGFPIEPELPRGPKNGSGCREDREEEGGSFIEQADAPLD